MPRAEALPRFWAEDELIRLFGVLDGWLRDWVILDANTGLRVSALLGLRWRDISFPNGQVTVPPHLSKSGKSYSVPMNGAANEVLARRWTKAPSRAADAFVFTNPRTGKPFDRNTVRRRIGLAVRRAGIRDFGHHAHAIRHSFAVALVNADVGIRVIQQLLGHASIRTTEVYAKCAPGKAEAMMGRFEISPPAPPASGHSGTSPTPASGPSG